MRSFAIVFLVLFLGACKTGTVEKPFDWQGHRGARGEAPENTIPAMLRALQEGVFTLELDVVISADSQVVVSHEPFFNPLICLDSQGNELSDTLKLNLFNLTYAEIKSYDCGSKKNPDFPTQANEVSAKPLLIDLLGECEEACLMMGRDLPSYNIEIKSRPEWDGIYSPDYETYADLVLETLDKANLGKRLIIQSFDVRTLRYIHDIRPDISLAYLLPAAGPGLKEELNELGFVPKIVSPHFSLVNANFIRDLKTLDSKVIPWTVNEIEEAKRLRDLGVDGIITDYPARMISALGSF